MITTATVYEDYHWVGEVDFADNNTEIKDLFVAYTGIDGIILYGPEFAVARGPVSVFGEYTRATLLRGNKNQVSFDAFHVAATL